MLFYLYRRWQSHKARQKMHQEAQKHREEYARQEAKKMEEEKKASRRKLPSIIEYLVSSDFSKAEDLDRFYEPFSLDRFRLAYVEDYLLQANAQRAQIAIHNRAYASLQNDEEAARRRIGKLKQVMEKYGTDRNVDHLDIHTRCPWRPDPTASRRYVRSSGSESQNRFF